MKHLSVNLNAFGKDAEAAAQPQEHASFDELIKGAYKQDFDARVQAILDRRFKTANAELAAVRPVMALLRQRYNIPDGANSAGAVLDALKHDEPYWTAAADAVGMPPAQYRRLMQAEAESKELRAMLSAQQTRQRRNELYRQLNEQAEQLQEQYPDFDLAAELRENPRFGMLLSRGIDMRTAYQVCHQDEILSQTAQQAESLTLDKVRANRARPVENGRGGTQPVKLGSDPSKWTREQFREVGRRVSRGERIVL